MGKNFLSATANFDDFANLASAEINSHVQKNNDSILKKVFNFFQTDSNILLINGFAGVGKKQIAEHTLSYLDKDTIILKYVCVDSSNLDDVLLTFFSILKSKISGTNLSELDAIENIKDKVEFFFSKSEVRFVPVFYNFDNISEQNKQDILNYIFSLAQRESFKVVICARTFDTDIIPQEIKYIKVVVKALSKVIFETYLREFGIKVSPAMLDQLYRLTRGYFFSACICAKYMINQELTLNDFIVRYTNSGDSFDTFLAKAYYTLIVGTTKSAFNLFLKLQHGLNLKILQTIGSYPEIIFKTLSENFYIYKKGKNYYPNDFLKLQLTKYASDEISPPRLVNYYKKQLELSPADRDVLISRASLQEIIAFYEKDNEETPQLSNDHAVTAEGTSDMVDNSNSNSVTADNAYGKYDNTDINELISMADTSFKSYKYSSTIEILTAIMERKNDISSDVLYNTYFLLAQTYSKLTKWSYALYYYDVLEKHFETLSDIDNINKIQFEKAFIYYQCYKIIDAIKILKNLTVTSKQYDIIAKSDILLGNIALSASNKIMAQEYFADGLKHSDGISDSTILMELYFKNAVLADENGDIDLAIKYYKKCIELNDEKCKYFSLAYSNLGDLFFDNNLLSDAKMCFENTYNADKKNNNYYGMYYSLTKILELTDRKEKEARLALAAEAKECALKTDDYNALLLSVIQLGDEYYNYPDPQKALAEYMALYNEGVDVIEEPNFSLIKSRINDIKARIGKEEFERLAPNYG